MNGIGPDEIERFMQAVAGKHLSVRDIERLAQAYFRGPASLREAIDRGRWRWTLDQMRASPRTGKAATSSSACCWGTSRSC